jgi:hypothetical protein
MFTAVEFHKPDETGLVGKKSENVISKFLIDIIQF